MAQHKVRSISRNLTISLVAVIISISLAFILIYYYHLSKKSKLNLENTADEYILSITNTLEIPLWNIDREIINRICEYYYQNDLIVMVKIVDLSGETLFNKTLNTNYEKGYLINRSRDIFHKGEWIGKVTISLSSFRSREIKLEMLKASVAALFISVAGLIFSTGFLLKKVLKEPLDFLGKIAKSYSMGNYHPKIKETLYFEFKPLVSALIDMGETIESQMIELQQAEEFLKKHRDHLEEMVDQRTKELETSNKELQNEIHDRKIAQKKLKTNEQRLKAILRASPVGIGLVINRKLDWANDTLYHMVGYDKDSLKGMDKRILYQDEFEYERVGKELFNRIVQAEIGSVETQWVRKNGTVFDCSIHAYPLDTNDPSNGQIVAVADISEAKLLESRLQRAEKMEAIGTLAGGVAHDLNNILSGIVSYPEILLLDLPEESPFKKPLSTIKKSGERAVEIVQDLLTMARRGVSITEVINLNHLLIELFKSPEMAQLKFLYPNVKINSNLEQNLFNIKGSSTHLSKSIMNLIYNSVEAMPGEGNIVISTSSLYLDMPVKGYEQIKEGDYVKLSVLDTGIGISEKDTEKIFEPFYTNKVMGRSGTGLGMAVVWGTVKDHNGYIDIDSSEGKGTVFSLYFPVTREKLKSYETETSLDDYMVKDKTVLVIDDVKEQREIASVILGKLGYTVFSVSSGEKACEYLKKNSVDLLVLDMIMDPGIDGLDTYKRIIELHPKQKAIIASGYSKTKRVRELQKLGAGKYIKKPYTLAKIGSAAKEELNKIQADLKNGFLD